MILGFLTDLRLLVGMLIEMSWRGFAMALDGLVSLSPFQAAMVLVGILTLHVGLATRMQKHLNESLSKDPQMVHLPILVEARFSVIGAFFAAISWIVTLPLRILSGILNALSKKKDDEEKKKEEEKPVLVPALGPSYLWAALITSGIWVLAIVLEPLIRWQLDLPRHFPTWQYLLFGHRPELAPFVPLQTYPYVGAVVIVFFWVFLWWMTARVVRLTHWDAMGVNLVRQVDNHTVLPSWRTHFGVTDLANRDVAFDTWAKWLPFVAVPFVLLAFFALSGEPYRVNPSAFGIAVVCWVSWALHMRLTGIYRPVEDERGEEKELQEATAPGWIDVLNDLRRVHRISPPKLSRPLRDVEPLAYSRHRLEGSQLISPMLAELLPEPRSLTAMQHNVLAHLSRNSFVHLEVPGDTRTLELGSRERHTEEELRHRNQIVIAPEGAGKTTLAMLAAFNTALIHTRSTLVVLRNEEAADKLTSALKDIVEPSTLRWNLRVRRIGGDLIEDLSAGIVPDVIICDLQQLVTVLLDDVETYRSYLVNLGLIIIDDLETFCGPVEVHAQLAFRRLNLRLRSLKGIGELAEEHAPIFLLLGGETMDDLPAWARSLCGIDAVPRYFTSQRDAQRMERARQARRDVDQGHRVRSDDDHVLTTPDGRIRRQLIYELKDFRRGTNQLSVLDIVEACEALAVPWHYRPCGDDRILLGRSVLPLRNEPQAYVDSPLRAAVVFLDGHASAVERELERLQRAGAAFSSRATPLAKEEELQEGEEVAEKENKQETEENEEEVRPDEIEPIALITIVDPEESLIYETSDDADEELADLLETLPRPFLRPPSGYLTRRHLTSELIQHWTEVADLLDVFGNDIAPDLRNLTRQGAILQDPRTTLEPGKKSYERRVFLRGLEAEILGGENSANEAQRLLPGPVEDVEVASHNNIAVRERTTLVTLSRVDAESARHRFYPGRIFDTLRGRHVVVAYADENASREGAFEVGDVICEPFLGQEITSPRRRVVIELVAHKDTPFTPEPVFLGRAAIGVGLFSVQCRVRHEATFRLEPQTGEVRQRIYRNARDRERESVLRTRALGLFPVLAIKESEAATPLTLSAARLVAAALRAVTPLIYRGADTSLGIALHLSEESSEESPAPETMLTATDGFFFYDLHGNGNGAARAIERDGIAPILRMAHHLVRHLQDPRRLLNLHDEWDGLLDEAARAHARERALLWFSDVLLHDEEEES